MYPETLITIASATFMLTRSESVVQRSAQQRKMPADTLENRSGSDE